MKTRVLNDGRHIPAFGLGTWKSAPGEVGKAIKEAVRIGYRHIDCAWIYGNEVEIGEALADLFDAGTVNREDLWITTKMWNDCHAREHVQGAAEASLKNLRLDYVDLYLIHWSVHLKHGVGIARAPEDFLAPDAIPFGETWQGMEALVTAGLARSIGVSNFSREKLAIVLESAHIVPAMNQVEGHPYLQQPDLMQFCREKGIAVTAYAPLGSKDRPARLSEEDEPTLLEDPVIMEIAAGLGVSPAQVLISWAIHRDTVVIPKSVNPQRLAENYRAAQLSLCQEDMAKINALDRHRRYITGKHWCMEGSPYTIEDVWDE